MESKPKPKSPLSRSRSRQGLNELGVCPPSERQKNSRSPSPSLPPPAPASTPNEERSDVEEAAGGAIQERQDEKKTFSQSLQSYVAWAWTKIKSYLKFGGENEGPPDEVILKEGPVKFMGFVWKDYYMIFLQNVVRQTMELRIIPQSQYERVGQDFFHQEELLNLTISQCNLNLTLTTRDQKITIKLSDEAEKQAWYDILEHARTNQGQQIFVRRARE